MFNLLLALFCLTSILVYLTPPDCNCDEEESDRDRF